MKNKILACLLGLFLSCGVGFSQQSGGGGSGGGGSGTPGGASGQIQYNNSGAFGGFTPSQDCTVNTSTGVFTCTKSNNVTFGTGAFQNTGVSGTTLPFLNGVNTWSGVQSFSNGDFSLLGSGSGNSLLEAPATGGGTATLPSGSGTLLYSTGVTGIAPISVATGVVSIAAASNSALGTAQCDGISTTCHLGIISGQTPINAQTGTSYSFLSSDCAELVTFTNSSAVAATLPAASATGFTASCKISVHNYGAGTVSITPNAPSNIGLLTGQAAFTMPAGYDCSFTSDSANWQLSACTASLPSTTPYSAKVGATLSVPVGSPVAAMQFTNLTGAAPYTLNCWNITLSGAGNIEILFSENNGSTYLTANYLYRGSGRSSAAAVSINSASAAAIIISDTTIPASSGLPFLPYNFNAVLANLTSTTVYKDIYGQADYSNSTPTSVELPFGGSYSGDTNAINAVEIKGSANSIAGNCSLGALN